MLLTPEAIDFSRVTPELGREVGWLCLGVVVCALAWAASRMESIRRSFLALEDPRMFAVMRIGVALMTIQCFWNMKPHWRMLWSDEGLFDLEDARTRYGSAALSGWTPEDGFLDLWAVGKFLWGKHSPFYFFSDPAGVEWVMYGFFALLVLYAAGVLSRLTGVLCWLMLSGVYNHNMLYLEGTDTVYRCMWWILIFARTGDAWSVDNWWRCRRLRRRGRLQEAFEEPQPGKQPIYRLVPSWPRYLLIGQLVAIYTDTGLVKTGGIWAHGDALYYALNLDHFYRFEDWTQQVSAVFGTNVFRVMTWVTRWWEVWFPLAALGMALKFGLEHRHLPWYRAQQSSRLRVWFGRLALLLGYLAVYRIAVLGWGYVNELPKNKPEEAAALVEHGVRNVHLWMGVVTPLLVAAWYALGRWPLRVRRWTIDQVFVRKWLLGRRLWLGLGAFFHGFLIVFMNIGMFPFIMLMTYAAWFTGEEFAAGLRWLLRVAMRTPLRKILPPGAEAWTAAAQPSWDIPARGRRIPDLLVFALGLLFLGVVYKKIAGDRDVSGLVYGWVGLTLAVAAAYRWLVPRIGRARGVMSLGTAGDGGPPALAVGAPYRALALGFVLWHGAAVALHLFPNSSLFTWRSPARGVFGGYLTVTGTTQSWLMFAPNPPRANTFLKTVVIDQEGRRWDIGGNAFSYRPFPWIFNDRIRKMHRRMISKGKWYLRPWAFYQCREWFLQYGEPAAKVELYQISTQIPTPDQVRAKGWYRPTNLPAKVTLLETHTCPNSGQLPAFMKQRYGVPLTEADERQLEEAAERQRKLSEQRRRTWASRRDWGGKPAPQPPVTTPARQAGSEDDGGPADGE